jgi:prolyl-tRNA synthetase
MLGVYRDFMENWMAMPVVTGRKTDSERFAGALRTYSCEAMMQDRKALQAGTSHNLGQNFARVFELQFQSESGSMEFAWNTSWGVSTRLIGGLVMTHGDDIGLRVPPRLAPTEIVVIPIWRSDEERSRVYEAADAIQRNLSTRRIGAEPLRVKVDKREGMKPGAKYFDWEMRGIPLRIELGPRDLDAGQAVLVRRDVREKKSVPLASLELEARGLLDIIQGAMLASAVQNREANSVRGIESYDRFRQIMEADGGFVYAGWCGDPVCEARVKDDTKATIRVLPDSEFRSQEAPSKCMSCGRAATEEALWARAY